MKLSIILAILLVLSPQVYAQYSTIDFESETGPPSGFGWSPYGNCTSINLRSNNTAHSGTKYIDYIGTIATTGGMKYTLPDTAMLSALEFQLRILDQTQDTLVPAVRTTVIVQDSNGVRYPYAVPYSFEEYAETEQGVKPDWTRVYLSFESFSNQWAKVSSTGAYIESLYISFVPCWGNSGLSDIAIRAEVDDVVLYREAPTHFLDLEAYKYPVSERVGITENSGVCVHFPFNDKDSTLSWDCNEPLVEKVVAETGFKWLRHDMLWDDIEHQADVFEWSAYDSLVSGASVRGRRVLLIADYGNVLYWSHESDDTDYDDHHGPTDSVYVSKYARFVAEAAEHYESEDNVAFEIWNEPHHPGFWHPEPNPEDYGVLVGAVLDSLEARDLHPEIYFGSMSLSKELEGFGFARDLMAFNESEGLGISRATGISYHGYRWYNETRRIFINPEQEWVELARLKQLLQDNDCGSLSIICSEWGQNYEHMLCSFYPDEPDSDAVTDPEDCIVETSDALLRQAVYGMRMVLGTFIERIPVQIQYELTNYQSNGADGWAFLDGDITGERPVYLAYKYVHDALYGMTAVGVLDFGRTGLHGVDFRRGTEACAAIWNSHSGSTRSVAIPQCDNMYVTDMFGDPVDVDYSICGMARFEIDEDKGPVFVFRPDVASSEPCPVGEIFISASPDSIVGTISTGPFQLFDVYVLASIDFADVGAEQLNQSIEILGWEYGLNFSGPDSSYQINTVQLPEGIEWDSETTEFVVTVDDPISIASGQFVELAKVTLFTMDVPPEDDVLMSVSGLVDSPSSIYDEYGVSAPGWMRSIDSRLYRFADWTTHPLVINASGAAVDSIPPEAVLATRYESMVKIVFDENVDPATVFVDSIAIVDSVSLDELAASEVEFRGQDHRTMYLQVTGLSGSSVYSATIAGVADFTGNVMVPVSGVQIVDQQSNHRLSIVELFVAPYNPSFQFVEIFNGSVGPIDLRDLVMRFQDGSWHVIEARSPIVVESGDVAVVARSDSAMSAVGCVPDYVYADMDLDRYGSIDLITLSYLDEREDWVANKAVVNTHVSWVSAYEGWFSQTKTIQAPVSLGCVGLADPDEWCNTSMWNGVFKGSPGYVDDHCAHVCAVDSPTLSERVAASPNPFNPSTKFAVSVTSAGRYMGRIYDMRGRLVRTLFVEHLAPGTRVYDWDGADDHGRGAAAGVYYVRVSGGARSFGSKCLLLR